ncbi:MAG: transglycosylase SLT domain-containing protein [Prevotella sp.]|nr:transglycosylase SLT domain-containing protein [Prevotella sp.]
MPRPAVFKFGSTVLLADYSGGDKLQSFVPGVFITSSGNPFFLKLRAMRWRCLLFLPLLVCVACGSKPKAPDPWGVSESGAPAADGALQLGDIMTNGELIMVTLSGPDTYYEYHGRGMGLHYLLCERFCQTIGVSLRVEVCKDTAEMVRRIADGEADLAAFPMTEERFGELGPERASLRRAARGKWFWLVNKDNGSLAEKVDEWLTADEVERSEKEQAYRLSAKSITRRVYAPMRDKARGIISDYDDLFRRYAPSVRWDWRLLAAQCYQESTFDPRARSWAGACGLMQIMPATAEHLRLARQDVYNPDKNVAAAVKYISELTGLFADIDNPSERLKFVLASYNGGHRHIRDAMALARKHGANPHRWADVRTFVLRLSMPAYYADPVVKYGYMRGSETAEYVDRIISRWDYYRGVKPAGADIHVPAGAPAAPNGQEPHPSGKRKAKYTL